MGSYAECWLGSLYVGSTKDDIDPELMLLFRASDRVAIPCTADSLPFPLRRYARRENEEEGITVVYYRAPLPVVRDRLELAGYTIDACKLGLSMCLEAEAALYRGLASGKHTEFVEPLACLLEAANPESWLRALRKIRSAGLTPRLLGGDTTPHEDTLVGYMLEHDWYGYSGPDFSVALRCAMEACDEPEEFIYDVTDLITGECFSPDDDLVEHALASVSGSFSAHAKVIVLTEGRVDSRIIADSLRLLYPHLQDYFTFMDFENAKVGGGAGNLVNIVKAFVGTGIVNKVVTVFDNDTAGESAVRALKSLPLPRNIAVMRLPNLPALQSYPTIGPSGAATMDVNGLAASIELYLGSDVLAGNDGCRIPVQWTGYDAALRKYQGEVMWKDRIHQQFARRVETCTRTPGQITASDWSGMREVLESLIAVFRNRNSEDWQAWLNDYYSRR